MRDFMMNLQVTLIEISNLIFVIRFFLGTYLLIGAIRKIINYNIFVQGVFDYQILPANLSRIIGLLLPWIELLLGSSLILGIALPASSIASSLLIGVFVIAIEINLNRGRKIDCNCYGIGSTPEISRGKSARNILLLLLLVILFSLSLFTVSVNWLASFRNDIAVFLISPEATLFFLFSVVFLFLSASLLEWVIDIDIRGSYLRGKGEV